jgi:hypothetical protein
MKDALGHFHGVPRCKVEYALSHRIVFENDGESGRYERENRDAPAVSARRTLLLREVKESLDYEQWLRNKKAAEHGWPVHPNDVDWLDDEQRRDMLKTFSERGPFKDEWRNPEAE